MTQDMIDAVEGKIPYEDLTDQELFALAKLIDQAVAQKVLDSFAPGSKSIH